MSDTTLHLEQATIFADLNKKEAKSADFARTEITVTPLKYKHFRSVMQHPEADQMHYLMLALTGLTENDLGELCPTDAAAISSLVFESMKDYMNLGQKIARDLSKR